MSESTSYLTESEVEAAQALHKRTPYAITGVRHGQFSIARHYGGITFNGERYTYMPAHDELIRDDVLKLVTKLRKAGRKTAPTEAAPQNEVLF